MDAKQAQGNANSAATHFGRQMRKEREAHGWTLRDLAARTRTDFTTLSRVENGRRPPTQALAARCDELFPTRRGWFSDWYDESRTWAEVPAGFRSWAEVEERAVSLRDWYPGIVTGLLQSEGYARALVSVQPHITPEALAARLASRMERQRRVLDRDSPPSAWFIIDQMALFREIGSPEVMAAQCAHLLAVAQGPNVTMTVMPAVTHSANASGFILADNPGQAGSAWCEHLAGGYVYTEQETVNDLSVRFDRLRAESHRESDSLNMIERLGKQWAAGVNPLTATATAASA
jgi:transcriptional regulator with XRE-family HTH domain